MIGYGSGVVLEVQRCFVMSVKFGEVWGRYAPVMARELVRFCEVWGRYAPVMARELVRFCEVR